MVELVGIDFVLMLSLSYGVRAVVLATDTISRRLYVTVKNILPVVRWRLDLDALSG